MPSSLGVNLFDTADVYAQGEAERALGDAIAALPRSQLVRRDQNASSR